MNVIGLDLSLTSTGVASSLGAVTRIRSHPSAEVSPFSRLRIIRAEVMGHVLCADLVVVEGLSLGSKSGQHLTRAGLWHLVMEAIDTAGIPWAEVAPTALKKYATGKGNADKDTVLLAAAKRYPDHAIRGNDEADAVILAAMGADHLGVPIATMPAVHRAALDKVAWPKTLPALAITADGTALVEAGWVLP